MAVHLVVHDQAALRDGVQQIIDVDLCVIRKDLSLDASGLALHDPVVVGYGDQPHVEQPPCVGQLSKVWV